MTAELFLPYLKISFNSAYMSGKSIAYFAYYITICVLLYFLALPSQGQTLSGPIDESTGSDPAVMETRFTLDADAFYFVALARHYGIKIGYEYALQNKRHQFGMALPFLHTIYNADFAGFENTSGIGDLAMRYMFVPFVQTKRAGLQRVSTFLELTAPTGEFQLGRSAGSWVLSPGLIFTYRPNPYVAFYPELKYQMSVSDAVGLGGSTGPPDPNDTELDNRIQNLIFTLPAVVLVSDWDGWASMRATYISSMSENVDFLFIRADFGKMIGERTSAALNITKFVAGEPRLQVLVQFKLQFFM